MPAEQSRTEIKDYLDKLIEHGKSGSMVFQEERHASAYLHKINYFRRNFRRELHKQEGMAAFSPYDLFTIRKQGQKIIFEYNNPFEATVEDPDTGKQIPYKEFLDKEYSAGAAKEAKHEPEPEPEHEPDNEPKPGEKLF